MLHDYANGHQFTPSTTTGDNRRGHYWRGRIPETGMHEVERVYTQDDVIGPSIQQMVDGVLGKDPDWRLTPPEEDQDLPEPLALLERAATAWWYDRRVHRALREAKRVELGEGTSCLRLYLPERDDGQPIERGSVTTLEEALSLIHLHALTPTQAGSIRDEHDREVGHWYAYPHTPEGSTQAETWVEVHTADRVRTYRWNSTKRDLTLIAGMDFPNPLATTGGFLMHQLERESGSVITHSIRDTQDALNAAQTDLRRNGQLAGFPIWIFKNVEPATEQEIEYATDIPLNQRPASGDNPVGVAIGPNVAVNLAGIAIYNEHDQIIGYANPDAERLEPIDPEHVLAEIRHHRLNLLRAFDLLWQENALLTASGVSRQEARAAWDKRLQGEKETVEGAVIWVVESALALARWLVGDESDDEGDDAMPVQVEPRVKVDAAPADLKLWDSLRASQKDGQLSMETLLMNAPIEDLDAGTELQKLEPPTGPPGGTE